MKLIRFLAACVALTLVSSLAPGFAPPVSAAGGLVTSPETVPATPGQTLALGTLFQPVRGASLSFQYISVVVTLTGGLTFPDGGQTITSQGPVALPSALGIPVIAKGFGRATLKVTASDNGQPITDEATTMVDVVRPAPLPGEVPLLTTVGTASAKVGQPLKIGSLFKAVDMENQFNLVKTTIDVTLTGGLVFADNVGQFTLRPQFTRFVVSTSVYPHSKTMNDAFGSRDEAQQLRHGDAEGHGEDGGLRHHRRGDGGGQRAHIWTRSGDASGRCASGGCREPRTGGPVHAADRRDRCDYAVGVVGDRS